jgi:hypothetical protein
MHQRSHLILLAVVSVVALGRAQDACGECTDKAGTLLDYLLTPIMLTKEKDTLIKRVFIRRIVLT